MLCVASLAPLVFCQQPRVEQSSETTLSSSNGSSASNEPTRTERIQQLRAQHQRKHVERHGQYPLDEREERYEEAIRQVCACYLIYLYSYSSEFGITQLLIQNINNNSVLEKYADQVSISSPKFGLYHILLSFFKLFYLIKVKLKPFKSLKGCWHSTVNVSQNE